MSMISTQALSEKDLAYLAELGRLPSERRKWVARWRERGSFFRFSRWLLSMIMICARACILVVLYFTAGLAPMLGLLLLIVLISFWRSRRRWPAEINAAVKQGFKHVGEAEFTGIVEVQSRAFLANSQSKSSAMRFLSEGKVYLVHLENIHAPDSLQSMHALPAGARVTVETTKKGLLLALRPEGENRVQPARPDIQKKLESAIYRVELSEDNMTQEDMDRVTFYARRRRTRLIWVQVFLSISAPIAICFVVIVNDPRLWMAALIMPFFLILNAFTIRKMSAYCKSEKKTGVALTFQRVDKEASRGHKIVVGVDKNGHVLRLPVDAIDRKHIEEQLDLLRPGDDIILYFISGSMDMVDVVKSMRL